jgi:uncharacterized protein (DUF2225 family)
MDNTEVAGCAPLPRELYYKGYTDPLSGLQFEAPQTRASALRPAGRNADLAPRYAGPSPLHYGIVVAPSAFAADASLYGKAAASLIRDFAGLRAHVAAIQATGSAAALSARYNAERSLFSAAQSYQLAIGCAQFLRLALHEHAALRLRASWVLRDFIASGEADDYRARFPALRSSALELYKRSYEGEDLSATKLGYCGAAYLIGELSREAARYEESYRWLSRVVQDKTCSGDLLRLARERLELCQLQRREGAAAEVEYPAATATTLSTGVGARPVAPRADKRSKPPLPPAELQLTSMVGVEPVKRLAELAAERGISVADLLRRIKTKPS